MFIISLTYTAPLDAVDRHVDGHMAWVKAGYAEGLFLASGRKVPRTGGVILARGERQAVEAYCARDPFVVNGVAEVAVTEMVVSMTAEGLEGLKA